MHCDQKCHNKCAGKPKEPVCCHQAESNVNQANVGQDRIGQWGIGDNFTPTLQRPLDHLQNAGLNKELAFTIAERQALGIHGLLPPCVKTQSEQLLQIQICLDRIVEDLDKYIFLMDLLERNERLFFRFAIENVTEILPLVYTPIVGLACQKFGLVYRRPRGLYITICDKGHVYELLRNWHEPDVRAIVVTDGERILGLGDLGANGMGIPIGKLALYTALAGVKPHQCLAITLDVGTNTERLLDDPFYVGLNRKRTTGKEYDDLLDEFMHGVVKRWGRNTLIQFEDFGNSNAFSLLEKYRNDYCTFNDDIQGTASVILAGVLASRRLTNVKLSENVFVFQGAGEASLGIAQLCVLAMQAEGATLTLARSRIYLVDSKGLIVANRPEGGVTGAKLAFARSHAPMRHLAEVVAAVKPTILIGAAAVGGAFTSDILREMARNNRRPVIFALSNPTSMAECTARDAYESTDGACIFSSGSPFPPFEYNGRVFHPGQGNNAYIFPAIALACVTAGVKVIDEGVFLVAAESLAELVSDEDLEMGRLYPAIDTIRECLVKIAVKVVEYAYRNDNASVFPIPDDFEAFMRAQMYDTNYQQAAPSVYPFS